MSTLQKRMNGAYPDIVLLALNSKHGADAEFQLLREEMVRHDIAHLNALPVDGRYDGTDELAYMLLLPDRVEGTDMDAIIAIARKYNQKELWVCLKPKGVENKRRVIALEDPAFLHYVQKGYLVPCSQADAYRNNGFTFNAATGQHYILEEL